MNQSHYRETKQFKIYALISSDDAKVVYVGKTTSVHRLSAAYSRHVCGSVAASLGYFDDKSCKPHLHLLETVNLSTAEAYKRTLA